jgi:hypothetical protein
LRYFTSAHTKATDALRLAQSALSLTTPFELAESLSQPTSPSEVKAVSGSSEPLQLNPSSGLLNRHHRIWSARTRRQEETEKANMEAADKHAKVA